MRVNHKPRLTHTNGKQQRGKHMLPVQAILDAKFQDLLVSKEYSKC
jgi:hypothetical protein